ncbi:MAG: radical SAM protein [Muribaculaceae bacterium]|nr:radical SAM protein [Muribaculaceae bacterium]
MVSDSVITIAKDIFNIVLQHKDNLGEIKVIHPELFESLLLSKSIIPATNLDETAELIQSWVKEDENPEQIKITIIPTVQCNLRCWYCYENHSTKEVITEETIASIKRFIENTAKRTSIKKLVIDFFGGEPLLCFENCVKPIVLYAQKICKQYSKLLGIAFTTNGVLLTPDKCNFLSNINATTSFQITLDGDEKVHNAVRFLKGGKGTYDIILNNIAYAVSKRLHVSIRFNYTNKNHSSYESTVSKLLAEFRDS